MKGDLLLLDGHDPHQNSQNPREYCRQRSGCGGAEGANFGGGNCYDDQEATQFNAVYLELWPSSLKYISINNQQQVKEKKSSK
jgi:hypothetical protein